MIETLTVSNKVSNNLGRLTLVVPTFRRQDFVLRLIKFWTSYPVYLLVLDGSENAIPPDVIGRFGSRLKYLHEPVGFYDRLRLSLNLVDTEYVAWAGDEEFYIPSAVDSCIRKLDDDLALVAVCGRSLGFDFRNSLVIGTHVYQSLENYKVFMDVPAQRLTYHMKFYVPSLLYAICRTAPWKKSWEYTLKTEFDFYAAAELQFEMCMSYAGKSEVINELMWMRSNEVNSIYNTDPSLDIGMSFSSWWADKDRVKEREEFISIMARGFNELLPCDGKDLRGVVVDGVEAYLDFCKSYTSSLGGLAILRRFALAIIPGFVRPFLKSVMRGFHRIKSAQHTEFLQSASVLEESGVCVDFRALEEIRKVIIQFYKNRSSLGV